MDSRVLIGVSVVLLMVVLFFIQSVGECGTTKMIQGFWVVSEQFKNEAKIDQLIFYFNKGEGHMYDGYILTRIDGEVSVSSHVKFEIHPCNYFANDSYKLTIYGDNEVYNVFPKIMNMKIDRNAGSMTLTHNKKVYALLFKDNQSSDKIILEFDQKKDYDSDSDSDSNLDSDLD